MSREEQLYESIEFVKESEDLPSQQEETAKAGVSDAGTAAQRLPCWTTEECRSARIK